jgi:SAM-dependent methyltransferase
MLREAFFLAFWIPGVKRTLVKGLYQTLTVLDEDADVTCLNYGYASLDPEEPGLPLPPDDEVNRYCLALYHRVAGAVELNGREVLEVGSGRHHQRRTSHNYPSMMRFLGEAARVLRPNGHFLITDHRDKDKVELWREQIRQSGFSILAEEDITANVIQALDIDNERKVKLIDRKVPKLIRNGIEEFAAVKGTKAYSEFTSRESLYLRFTCRKTH